MDTIELARYPGGNVAGEKTIVPELPAQFIEFFLNNTPLSAILSDFYKTPVLVDYTGVLGAFGNKKVERIKIRQLLLESVSDDEIAELFPGHIGEKETAQGIKKYREELEDIAVILYCCAECGDYACGGFTVSIGEVADTITWTFGTEGNLLVFQFDRQQYFSIFDQYRKGLREE